MNEEKILMENIDETMESTATEESVEKVEEPKPRTYTQEELNEIVGKRNARTEAKIRREYEKKYGEFENVMLAGTGKEKVEDVTNAFKEYYTSKGINIPEPPMYSDHDIEVLAKADAEDIINSGFEEVVEEVERLSNLGADKLNDREKALFQTLAEYRKTTERGRELSKIGVSEAVYKGKEFTDFAAKFTPGTPITEIYEIYNKMQPREEVQTMGSMKDTGTDEGAVKDFYTYEEASKFTKADFDKNPELFKAVEKSMRLWK